MKSGDHHEYRDRRDRAIFHRRRDCDAAPLAIQAAFAQELARLESRRRFPSLGQTGQWLDLAFLNVKYRARDVALLQTRAGSCEI
jgi:hypothetical protein